MENQNKPDPSEIELQPKRDFLPHHKYLWLVIAVLLLIVIAGTYFWWQEIKQEAVNSNQITDNAKPDSTSTWKTYSSAEYGFEIKYPQTWAAREENIGKGYYLILASPDEKLALLINKDGTYDNKEVYDKATASEKELIDQILSTFKFTK